MAGYCQFGAICKQPTQIRVFNNPNFRGKGRRCSATCRRHTPMVGRPTGKDADKWETTLARAYSRRFCEYIAKLVMDPTPKRVYAKHIDVPPPEHYWAHLPKHPGCKACCCVKMQAAQCRDAVIFGRRLLHLHES